MPVDVEYTTVPYEQDTRRPLVDGFTLSTTMLYLPTTYRTSAIIDMEALRRANSYRPRWYVVPDVNQTIPAYSQLEYQVSSIPGSYLWGLMFYLNTDHGEEPMGIAYTDIHIQITDACTETPLFSDYALGSQFQPSLEGIVPPYIYPYRNPCIITPRLLGDPAKLNVEIYNRYDEAAACQLVLFIAEPMLQPSEIERLLRKQGIETGV